MKNLLNRKLFELFELFDKKVRNYSLFDKFLNPYLNPSLAPTASADENASLSGLSSTASYNRQTSVVSS
jgi:hypothetical protein